MTICDRPMASPGLTSYRYRSGYGFVMIGARSHADAMREARRSISTPGPLDAGRLEVWDGTAYAPVPLPPSREAIEAAKSSFGGWTRETLAGWRVSWPPPKGWRRALEAMHREITDAGR